MNRVHALARTTPHESEQRSVIPLLPFVRIAEVTQQTRFASSAEIETTLERYVTLYNHHIPQRALNHQTPIQALKKWQKKKTRSVRQRRIRFHGA